MHSAPHPGFALNREDVHVGTWLSLVEHSLGVRGVGSSNLPVPTNSFDSTQPVVLFVLADLGCRSTSARKSCAEAKRTRQITFARGSCAAAHRQFKLCPSRPLFSWFSFTDLNG